MNRSRPSRHGLRTVEVRWFLAGPCPEAVIEWFHAGERVGEPERRADEYALLARDDLGIKRRGADVLDIKVRTAQLDSVSLPDGLVGRVEAWTKWSVPLGASGALPMESVVVSKTRWSRRYELIADTTTRPIALTQLVSVGCFFHFAFSLLCSRGSSLETSGEPS